MQRQLPIGQLYATSSPLELELARLIIELVPCAEMVRYARGGGEACAAAIRIARSYSRRDKVLFCGYHGWHDWYISANLSDVETLNDHLRPGIDPLGVPARTYQPENGYLHKVRGHRRRIRRGSDLRRDRDRVPEQPGRRTGVFRRQPDMGVFGRAMGNGFPLTCVAVKADVMMARPLPDRGIKHRDVLRLLRRIP